MNEHEKHDRPKTGRISAENSSEIGTKNNPVVAGRKYTMFNCCDIGSLTKTIGNFLIGLDGRVNDKREWLIYARVRLRIDDNGKPR